MQKRLTLFLLIIFLLALCTACDPYTPTTQGTPAVTTQPVAVVTVPSTPGMTQMPTEPTIHVHSYYGQLVDATCTDGGYMLHACSCGDSFRDSETEALGHTWLAWEIVTYPTQEQEGLQIRTCQRCGAENQQILPALQPDHTHSYDIVVIEPTCTEPGYILHTCICGDDYETAGDPALGHSFVDYQSNHDATCTSDGTKTACCIRCSVLSTIQDVGTALGHNWGEWVTDVVPTTETEGSEKRTCNGCDATDYRVLEKLPPVHTHSYVPSVVAPTCTSDGYTRYDCPCGDSYQDTTVPSNGHDWGEWTLIKAPTVQTEGMEQRQCNACGATDTVTVDKLPDVHVHSYSKEKFPATCTQGAYTRFFCECGDSYEEITSEPKGHTWGYWFVSKDPTTAECGERQRICDVCGECERGSLDVLAEEGAFIVVTWPDTIGRNVVGTVVIKGQPGVKYDIDVYYKSGISSAKGLEDQVADENGYVIWSWKVGPSTASGTYKIVITGGGQQQTLIFTVVVA